MISIVDIIKPSQDKLFSLLQNTFAGNSVTCENNFILVKGVAPILLVAHLDTVHQYSVETICKSDDGNILMSPQGIGGDDRCGVFALLKIYESAKIKPYLLFTCNEEIGGIGAKSFASAFKYNLIPCNFDSVKLIIELDRKGKNDAVYYDCDNPDLENYISGKGFVTSNGSFSDISIIAPALGIAAVNLSCGYYNPHNPHEFINLRHLNSTIDKVLDIVEDSTSDSLPKFPYVEKLRSFRYFSYVPHKKNISINEEFEDIPDFQPLPSEFHEIYDELLEIYTVEELEDFRHSHGDYALVDLYFDSFDYGNQK